jgi:hypothetical protein
VYQLFISYSHSDHDVAVAVFDRLVAAGQTVWMDDSGTAASGEFVGIPAGQRHRDVIQNAILDSATFLIVDSAAWRASEYCADEWELARAAGRRIAAIADPALPPLENVGCAEPLERLGALVDRLEQHAEVALAQVRLDEARLHGGAHPSLLARLLGRPERLADAETLATAGAGDDLPRVTPAQADFVRQVMRDAGRGRRRRRAAGISLVVVLALLAVASGVAGLTARADADSALASQRRAESLGLAGESLAGNPTAALDLARRAWLLDRNDESGSALSSATAAGRRVDVRPAVSITGLRQLAAVPGGLLVASDGASLTTLDRFGQRVAGTPLPSSVGRSPILVAAGVAVVLSSPDADQQRSLYRYDPSTGAVSTSSVRGISSAGQGPHDETWLAVDGNAIAQYSPADDSVREFLRVEGTITAVDATESRVTVLTEDLTVWAFDRLESGLVARRSLRLPSLEMTSTTGLGAADPDRSVSRPTLAAGDTAREVSLDRVIHCGERLNLILGASLAKVVASTQIALADDLTPLTGFTRVSSATSFACRPDGALVGAGPFVTRPVTFVPGEGVEFELITIADRFSATAITILDGHLVVLVNSGELRVAGDSPDLRRSTGASMFAAPVVGGTLLQDLVGTLWFVRAGAPAVEVGAFRQPLAASLASGSTTIAWAGEVMVRLGPDGVVRQWEPVRSSAWSLSPDGEHVVIVAASQLIVRSVSAAQESATPLPALPFGESIEDVAGDGTTTYLWTSAGRILRLDAAGAVVATWAGSDGRGGHIALGPGRVPGLLLVSRDNIVRLFDEHLQVRASRYVGAVGTTIESSLATGVAVIPLQSQRLLLLDTSTLRIRQTILAESGLSSARLSPDGTSFLQFHVYRRTKSEGATAVFQDLTGVWKEAASTGVYPVLPAGQDEIEGWIVQSAVCLSCSPG